MRRLLIVLTAAFAFCVVASLAGAANPVKITDPTGDATGVPDIVEFTVEDAGANLTIAIQLATMPDLAPDGLVLVLIDSDRTQQTGGFQVGADFVIEADTTGAGLYRWNGTTFESAGQTVSPTLSNGRLQFTVPKATLGSPRVDVFVVSTTTNPDSGLDAAPDNSALTYPPSITRLVIPGSVLSVRAGGVLNARTVQAEATPVAGQTVTLRPTLRCTLTYKGKTIKAMAGGCRWRIPARLRGKRLTLRLTATVGTETRAQTVTVRVR